LFSFYDAKVLVFAQTAKKLNMFFIIKRPSFDANQALVCPHTEV